RVAVRVDAERRLAPPDIPGYERADRVLVDLEAELLERTREVVERVAVDLRVGIPPDRLARQRVVGPAERLDVARNPLAAAAALDRDHRGHPNRIDWWSLPRAALCACPAANRRMPASSVGHVSTNTRPSCVLGLLGFRAAIHERAHGGNHRWSTR